MIHDAPFEKYIHDPYWTTERLREELEAWKEAQGDIDRALANAMEEEDVDEWEDLSLEWEDSMYDYYQARDRADTLQAALQWREAFEARLEEEAEGRLQTQFGAEPRVNPEVRQLKARLLR